ncbi:MarR family transcriptional regulator [Cryobacterium sp. PH29-G1]|uniref:MarR family winged helix-turn-helix transcriptional regulator n=1 Tax=Cryobacterium sp. PH29-G1 TaxID=3046211 RepID=UPI0024BBB5BB|nr:MarR family transcriptional regulator [Cryobacterium sp. PH29-G1]MDJ0347850.1 MarR family transcriptional regulator [Cryobacterium sp. PH29-G1]
MVGTPSKQQQHGQERESARNELPRRCRQKRCRLPPLLGEHDPGRHAQSAGERGAESNGVEPRLRLEHDQTDTERAGRAADHADQVDRILEQWNAEKPDLDVSPMAVIGRLSRTAQAVESRLGVTFARYGLDASSFDVLATLRRSGAPDRITPAALARNAMISTSAVAQRLNKLQSRRLVGREHIPTTAAAPWWC